MSRSKLSKDTLELTGPGFSKCQIKYFSFLQSRHSDKCIKAFISELKKEGYPSGKLTPALREGIR